MEALTVELSEAQLDELASRVAARLAKPAPDRWLDTSEAAEYVGLHVDTLRRYAAEGTVPSEQHEQHCRRYFRQSELDAWREGQR